MDDNDNFCHSNTSFTYQTKPSQGNFNGKRRIA